MNWEILAQKIILLLIFPTGYFLVIRSPINYYGIAATIVLVVTFAGGIVADRRNNSFHNSYLPTVSVLIPAKDEEKNIYHTIENYAKIDYPKNRIEVIVVDDGSRDRTWNEIKRAISEFRQTLDLKAFSFPTNQGKRRALSFAVEKAGGEIVVTTDSDTFVYPECIRNLVEPLEDREVAGATGHTYVKNRNKNFLTKMQAGIYFYAYRVVRSFESSFGTVLCLPGTLSAFRKEYVLKVLDEWERTKPILGEDRRLTCLLLKEGYRTVYVKNAKCETVVPETFRKYLSQQLRWAKGYLMETFRGCRYMFRKNPVIALAYYTQYFLTLYLCLAVMRIFLFILTGAHYWWGYFVFVGTAFFFKALYSCRTSKDTTCWAMTLFLFINLLMNLWRIPLALLTLSQKSRWSR